ALKHLVQDLTLPLKVGPRFCGGLVGYLAYDLVHYLENIPPPSEDDWDLPEIYMILPRIFLVYDHLLRKLLVGCLAPSSEGLKGYREAVDRIRSLMEALQAPLDSNRDGGFTCGPLQTDMSPEEFLSKVRRAKEYIQEENVLQIVLAQRFTLPFQGNPFSVYRRLRSLNPSPYMFYLHFPEVQLVGSSPEMLVRVEDREIQYNPIAGTRPRGRTREEERRLREELVSSEKDRLEHLMLLDLARNDVGKVAAPGTLRISRQMEVELYSHVMHLVSTLKATLAPGKEPLDALWACFPAGTVTGAPKIKAMEIIAELEPVARGPYGGAVGYLSLNGNLDTCITIRTIIFHRGRAVVQAGAGIVADSSPGGEYQETLNKAQALLQVLTGREEDHAAYDR
ncbi:MAG TPA: anthranilate synthase component I, partial [Moorella mulderi]|nr:anthranilate synthase component I [Moorella mulderi]